MKKENKNCVLQQQASKLSQPPVKCQHNKWSAQNEKVLWKVCLKICRKIPSNKTIGTFVLFQYMADSRQIKKKERTICQLWYFDSTYSQPNLSSPFWMFHALRFGRQTNDLNDCSRAQKGKTFLPPTRNARNIHTLSCCADNNDLFA